MQTNDYPYPQIAAEILEKTNKVNPDIRRVKHMAPVLYDRSFAQSADPELPVYYMHRAIEQRDGLRYDITVFPNIALGQEFNKTLGHYHSSKAQELYIVLEGQAIFMVQRRENMQNDKIDDVYYCNAKVGQGIIIPGGSAHFTINPQDKPLVIANWISPAYAFEYEPIVKMAGACYYYTNRGWVPNSRYLKVATLRQVQPLDSIPQKLDFLD